MSIGYIMSSLPALAFDQPAPMTWERFSEVVATAADLDGLLARFGDLDTQLRNALAEARGGAAYARPAAGCSLYWKNRVLAACATADVFERETLLDRVRWDAAGELTPPADPLGIGALATYAVRLQIALKRGKISREEGNAAFDRLTAETKIEF